jgi:hypothetical protein
MLAVFAHAPQRSNSAMLSDKRQNRFWHTMWWRWHVVAQSDTNTLQHESSVAAEMQTLHVLGDGGSWKEGGSYRRSQVLHRHHVALLLHNQREHLHQRAKQHVVTCWHWRKGCPNSRQV